MVVMMARAVPQTDRLQMTSHTFTLYAVLDTIRTAKDCMSDDKQQKQFKQIYANLPIYDKRIHRKTQQPWLVFSLQTIDKLSRLTSIAGSRTHTCVV